MTNIVGRTHAGARGGENEDTMGWDEDRGFAFVADGMGGYAGGEVASRTALPARIRAASGPARPVAGIGQLVLPAW